jgi:hypothetical protein
MSGVRSSAMDLTNMQNNYNMQKGQYDDAWNQAQSHKLLKEVGALVGKFIGGSGGGSSMGSAGGGGTLL